MSNAKGFKQGFAKYICDGDSITCTVDGFDLTATKYLAELLADGRAVNMIQVYRSRTGRKRGYRLFAIDPDSRDRRTTDITAYVCRAIGAEWNHDRGTFNSNQVTAYQDQHELSRSLTRALGRHTAIPVLIL